MLQIRFLGQFDVRADGKRLLISTRAAQSLFAFLVLTAGTPHRREKLAGLLWQDVSDENARRSLRQELWRLRKVLNSQPPSEDAPARANEYLLADELTVAFDAAASYWFDVAQLEQSPSSDERLNDLTRQVGLYKGELLPGFYDDWVLLERGRVEQVFELKMQQLVELLVQQERWTAALEWGERWIAQGHTPEPAYRALMLAHAALGNPSQVTLNYERCIHALQNELGVEPSEETRVLYEHLLKGAQLHYSPAQPTATVTFLFTDIEGSTRLLEKLREQYARVLHEHHEILRAAVQKWNGREIDAQGDAFFVAFARASDAVACAVEAQRALYSHNWNNGEAVRVRMGLHTGEPLMATTGYIGMDVHRAARIGDAGHGGQVLLSHTTRALVGAELPDGVTVRALGEHRLKDLKFPTDIYQLVIQGLPNDFPPLRTGFGAVELPAPGEPPFKGMEFFDEADAGIFFGREQLVEKLGNAIRANRFLAVVVGASGSGKSSLVRAGLVPALRNLTPDPSPKIGEGNNWKIFIMTPTAHPLEALAVTLTRDSESVTATATLLDDLTRDPRALQLFLRKQNTDHRTQTTDPRALSPVPRSLLVVDQFEELFTLCRDDFEREQFIDNLLDALQISTDDGASRSQLLTLVLTLRADFYSHLAQYPELRDAVAAHQEFIGPMNVEELRRAIEEPARQSNWEFEPGLVDLILRDVGDEPGALPLLSHALLETWKRRSGHTMTLKGYAESGGVRGAIAQTAETVYDNFSMEQQRIARDIFLRLTELGVGTEDTRRRVELGELETGDWAETRQVLTQLADARLVTTHQESVEVAHEALIREWPRLREWLNEDREGLRLHRSLTEAAHEWELMERDASMLYRGARLTQAREWASSNAERMNEIERAFLDASIENEKRESREREEQRERELLAARQIAEQAQSLAAEQKARAEEQTRSNKRLRRRAIFLMGALVVASVLAGIALWLNQQASQNAAVAQSLALNSGAQLASSQGNSDLALALALAANSGEQPVMQAQLTLADLAYTPGAWQRYLGHDDFVWSAAFSPDGKTALSGSLDLTMILWDVLSGKVIRRFRGAHTLPLLSTSFSPDGKLAVSSSFDGTFILWNVASGEQLKKFEASAEPVTWVAFSPDGKSLLSSSTDGILRLWDISTALDASIATGQLIRQFEGHNGAVNNVVFSPDGKTALSTSTDQTLILWDIATGQIIRRLQGHTDVVVGVAFSPDGKTALSGGFDRLVILWDLATGNILHRFQGHKDVVNAVAFTPDGRTALSTGGNNSTLASAREKVLLVWDIASGQVIQRFEGHTGAVTSLSVSPDGHSALTASGDKTLILWRLDSGAELYRLSEHSEPVNSVAYSPDGRMFLTSGADGNLILWDTASGKQIRRLGEHNSIVNAIAFSPDGRRALSGAVNGTLTLWDIQSGESLENFQGHTRPVTTVSFSRDGKTALSGSQDRTLILWDATTGQIIRRLEGHTNVVNSVALSPDSKRALSGSYDHTFILWNVETGQPIRRFPTQPSVINTVTFSPNGKNVVVGAADGTLVSWDLSGSEARRFSGHKGGITSAAFSPDGRNLISGSQDKTLLVWDAASGQPIRRFVGHYDAVNVVTFSPDGKHALSGSTDNTVRLWRIDSLPELINWIQANRAIPELPCEQRVLYGLETRCSAGAAAATQTP